MTYQNKSLWMRNGDTGYENPPKTEPKRPYNWFMDAHTPDQLDWFCTKKQALESANGHPSSVYQNRNFPLSGSGLFGHSGQNPSSNTDFRARCQDQPNDSLISLSMGPFNNANSKKSFTSMSPTFKRGDKDTNPLVHDSFFPINGKVVFHETAAPSIVPIGTTSNTWSEGNADPTVNAVVDTSDSKSKTNKVRKNNKELTKNLSYNFPTNVKSLLSTGILDGVPVKYVSWGRDKSLRGVIKGSNYLCDCSDCKLSTAVNAYEFERHAGCKTKHPNNHIHFQNGKTVYAIVQELKSTPQQNLFEAIQTVTGSPINEKKFRTWKESYEAATRILERI